jgi:hypothetical protein
MLRVSQHFLGDRGNERVIMGTVAVAEELPPGADELDELYRLDATETEPEPEPEPEEDAEEAGEEVFRPEDRPHP